MLRGLAGYGIATSTSFSQLLYLIPKTTSSSKVPCSLRLPNHLVSSITKLLDHKWNLFPRILEPLIDASYRFQLWTAPCGELELLLGDLKIDL